MQARNPNNIRIIDVSHHQGEIEWAKVATDGVRGVFIKATEGIGYTDPLFKKNLQGAIAAGLKAGVYHFAHPDNPPEAEAKYLADTINGLKFDLPLVLDLEQAKDKTADQLTAFALTWLEEVERLTGKRVMIYTGASFAKSNLRKALAKWPLWVAHYGVDQPMSNPTWDTWAVFQYADNGKVSGIKGNVDMNEMEVSFWMSNVVEKVDHCLDKEAAQKVIGILGALYTASADKLVQEAAHFAADALRDAAGIPK